MRGLGPFHCEEINPLAINMPDLLALTVSQHTCKVTVVRSIVATQFPPYCQSKLGPPALVWTMAVTPLSLEQPRLAV